VNYTNSQNFIYEAFISGRYVDPRYDVQEGVLYDSHLIDANTDTAVDLFTDPKSTLYNSGLYGRKSNLEIAGKLCPPEAFSVTGITVTASGQNNEATWLKTLQSVHYAFYVGCKYYKSSLFAHLTVDSAAKLTRNPISVCTYCAAVYLGFSCPNCGAGRSGAAFGEAGAESDFVFCSFNGYNSFKSIPVVIEDSRHFGVRLLLPQSRESRESLNGTLLRVALSGLHARSVS